MFETRREKFLLTVTTFLAVMLCIKPFIISPMSESLSSMDEEIATLRRQLDQANRPDPNPGITDFDQSIRLANEIG